LNIINLVEFVKIVGAKNAKALKCVVAASEGIRLSHLLDRSIIKATAKNYGLWYGGVVLAAYVVCCGARDKRFGLEEQWDFGLGCGDGLDEVNY